MAELDLNLLTALDALLAENSVTRAAQRLGLSTSAMSRTLTRLRQATGDRLLVQAGRQLVPTPYAVEIAERVHEMVGGARTLLQPRHHDVNLATVARTVVIRASDGFVDLAAAALLTEIQHTAPMIRLLFVSKTDKEATPLRDGNIDLEIGVLGTDAPELKTRVLFTDRFVGICRRHHPLLQGKGVTAERYVSFPHIVISRGKKLRGPVDHALEEMGLQRRIIMSVPAYTSAVNIVSRSDIIGLVPLSVLAWFQAGFDISHFELPVTTPPIKVSLIWHPRLQADPVHRWLRETIVAVCRREYSRLSHEQRET